MENWVKRAKVAEKNRLALLFSRVSLLESPQAIKIHTHFNF